MYLYEMLLAGSIITAVAALGIVGYLLYSRKGILTFKKFTQEETIPFDALSTLSDGVSSISQAVTLPEIHLAETIAPQLSTGRTHLRPVYNFNPKVLQGLYTLKHEIIGGGMGQVFLATKDNVGNDWIVKHVPHGMGDLTNESNILKELNHPTLPQIIDIFTDDTGLYLVENYIEGTGMDKVLKNLRKEKPVGIPEHQLLKWAEDLAQVLSYLHTRAQPIFHLDIKPSNIMVAHGNKLTLIDFGVSRKQEDAGKSIGVTLTHAAPEQIKNTAKYLNYPNPEARARYQQILSNRDLPDERLTWPLDARSDIYSLGIVLFEAATGQLPTLHNRHLLYKVLTPGFCKIVNKCLQTAPGNRYQSATDLLDALNYQKTHGRRKIATTLIARKIAGVFAGMLVSGAIFSAVSGAGVRAVEAAATMRMTPEFVVVSLQQSSDIEVIRSIPPVENPFARLFVQETAGEYLDPNRLSWQAVSSNIAQVDGNRVLGLNVGNTIISGQYRNQNIAIDVTVVEPMDGMVDIAMRFNPGNIVTLYAGSLYRERVDAHIQSAEFVSPQTMAQTAAGAIYFNDAGRLRRITDSIVETVDLGAFYLQAQIVRAYGDDIYVLSDLWRDGDHYFYSILRQTAAGFETIYIGDGDFTAIRDFYVTSTGVYLVERNEGVFATSLRRILLANPMDIYTLAILPDDVDTLGPGATDNIVYLATSQDGTIKVFEGGEITHLAGIADQQHFIDGTAPLFYRPTRIRYFEGALYVWDFNVLRKIYLTDDGVAKQTITLAGIASPAYQREIVPHSVAEQMVFAHSRLSDFIITDDGVLLSDPVLGVFWKIYAR